MGQRSSCGQGAVTWAPQEMSALLAARNRSKPAGVPGSTRTSSPRVAPHHRWSAGCSRSCPSSPRTYAATTRSLFAVCHLYGVSDGPRSIGQQVRQVAPGEPCAKSGHLRFALDKLGLLDRREHRLCRPSGGSRPGPHVEDASGFPTRPQRAELGKHSACRRERGRNSCRQVGLHLTRGETMRAASQVSGSVSFRQHRGRAAQVAVAKIAQLALDRCLEGGAHITYAGLLAQLRTPPTGLPSSRYWQV